MKKLLAAIAILWAAPAFGTPPTGGVSHFDERPWLASGEV